MRQNLNFKGGISMKKFLVLLLVFVSALAVFAEEVDWAIEDVAGKPGGTLFLDTTSGPKTMNPAWAQETSSTDIIGWVLDTLVHASNKGLAELPGLAKEFSAEVREDGKTVYTYVLRKGLKWSDGMPLTIDDVIWSFEKIWFDANMTANGNGAYLDSNNELPTIVKVDDYTVQFVYNTKFRRGHESIGWTEILPKHVLEPYVEEGRFQEAWSLAELDKVVASGPFVLKEYKEGVRVVLEKNPYYYRKDKNGVQLPYLDQIVYIIVKDLNTARLKFEAGETDIYSPTAEEFPEIRAMAEEKGWIVKQGGPNLGSNFVTFNFNAKDPVKRKWFRNVYFRRAIAFAIDKQTLIDVLYNGLGAPLYGPVSPSSGYYNPEVENLGFRYSLARAKKELRDGGFVLKGGKLYDADGNQVKFELTTNAGNNVREEIGNILKENLSKLGIEVNFAPMQFNALVGKLVSTGDWEAIIIGLTGSVDPASGWNVWRLDGGLHFWNYSPEIKPDMFTEEMKADYWVPDFEKRIDEIMRLQVSAVDKDELRKLLDEFQMLVAENQIVVYTVAQNYLVAYKNIVHVYNPEPNPAAGVLWSGWNIWKE
jgi:peptide/nickel transport system substrate-binding protein